MLFAGLFIAVAADTAEDTEPPSLLEKGPTAVDRVVLVPPFVLDEFDRLVFLLSRSIITISILNTEFWSRVIVPVLAPAEPDNAAIDCVNNRFTVSMASSIINSVFSSVKSPVTGGPAE